MKRWLPVKLLILISVLGLIFSGATLAALLLGYVQFGQNSSEVEPNKMSVCSERIKSYNDVIEQTDNSKTLTLLEDIETVDNKDNDSSCLFMLVQGYAFTGDIDKAMSYYDKLKLLSGNGEGVDLRIKSVTGIDTLKAMTESSRDGADEALGEG